MTHREELTRLYTQCRSELLDRVVPFWEEHSPDREFGGYFNCLDRDGSVYDTRKNVWLQGRQVWMFSKLFRTVDSKSDWLELSRLGAEFLRDHALRDDGRAYFSLTRDGQPLQLQRKIFSECFVAMAFNEFGRASGDEQYLDLSKKLFRKIWSLVQDPSPLGRPILAGAPDTSALAVPMILLNLIEEMSPSPQEALKEYESEINSCFERISWHVHEDEETVYETVAPGGGLIDSIEGRTLNPGHAIEAGWFLNHWARHLGDESLREQSINMIRWSHQAGWDETYGGLYYFLDSEGLSPNQLEWNMKLWWPHNEALYAHLLAFLQTQDEGDFQRLAQTRKYTFDHFPDPEHGGWFGYLDRRGERTHDFKGGPYKGCFHVPRALWLCVQLLEKEGLAP